MYSVAQYSNVRQDVAQCSILQQFSTLQHGTVHCSTVKCSTVLYSAVRYNTVQHVPLVVLEALLTVVQLPASLVRVVILLQSLVLSGHDLHLEGGKKREGGRESGSEGRGEKREGRKGKIVCKKEDKNEGRRRDVG
jgi:hypothetical protein